MLTDDEKIEYSLDIEPTLFRDRFGTLLVKLNNNKKVTVITDVTFYYNNNEIKLWGLENPNKFVYIYGKNKEKLNTDVNTYITDVLEFIDVN